MAGKNQRITTDGGADLSAANPFASLEIPSTPASAPQPAVAPQSTRRSTPKGKQAPQISLGGGARVEIRRLKAGKGGKTVTEIRGFSASHRRYLPELAKELKARFGVGGAVKADAIEIQGDQRDAVAAILQDRGFRPVLAGG